MAYFAGSTAVFSLTLTTNYYVCLDGRRHGFPSKPQISPATKAKKALLKDVREPDHLALRQPDEPHTDRPMEGRAGVLGIQLSLEGRNYRQSPILSCSRNVQEKQSPGQVQ